MPPQRRRRAPGRLPDADRQPRGRHAARAARPRRGRRGRVRGHAPHAGAARPPRHRGAELVSLHEHNEGRARRASCVARMREGERGRAGLATPGRRSSPTRATRSCAAASRRACRSRCCPGPSAVDGRARRLGAAGGALAASRAFCRARRSERRASCSAARARDARRVRVAAAPRRHAASCSPSASPSGRVAVCRELTKLHEEVRAGRRGRARRAHGRAAAGRGDARDRGRARAAPSSSREQALAALRELVDGGRAGARRRPARWRALTGLRRQRALPAADGGGGRVAWARRWPSTSRRRSTTSTPRPTSATRTRRSRADVLARHHRQRGEEVFFLTGTDEHGEPVALAAEREGVDAAGAGRPQRRALPGARCRSSTRATTSSSAPPTRGTKREVQEVPAARPRQRLRLQGHLRGLVLPPLRGLQGRERDRPRATRCPIHHIPLDREQEENWFFRLSAFQEQLERALRRAAGLRAAARRATTRRSRSSRGGLQRRARSPARKLTGACRCRGTPTTSSTSGSTRCSTTTRRSASPATART